MSDLTAQQYYNELIEAGQANDFTKLTSTGISSNYQTVFAFAEDYFEARMQANGLPDNHEQALPINSVRHFQFLSSNTGNEVIEEIDTDMHPPIKGQYVWLNGGVRFQVTAVHHDYSKRTLKIYCA